MDKNQNKVTANLINDSLQLNNLPLAQHIADMQNELTSLRGLMSFVLRILYDMKGNIQDAEKAKKHAELIAYIANIHDIDLTSNNHQVEERMLTKYVLVIEGVLCDEGLFNSIDEAKKRLGGGGYADRESVKTEAGFKIIDEFQDIDICAEIE